MSAIYNEIEPNAAAWLRELVARGLIADGVVDDRSISDLSVSDVGGYGQRHFFAGIGVWSYALRLAGVPDDLGVWTGSCPCQPFSTAGRRGGFDDERHLWPAWFGLIEQCGPPIVFGEQVASPDGLKWFDVVSADLERAGYSVGAANLCAAGVGAPHLRQRLYFVAIANGERCQRIGIQLRQWRSRAALSQASGSGTPGSMGNASGTRGGWDTGAIPGKETEGARERLQFGRIANVSIPTGTVGGYWRDAEWIELRDGTARPVEPGAFPLVNGTPARVGRLRGYGNAIVAQVAAEFIGASLEALTELSSGDNLSA